MSIKEKIDKLTAEYEQSAAESNRLWKLFQAEEDRMKQLIVPVRAGWFKAHEKTEELGHQVKALKELVGDRTAEQIEQDWSE